jgi:hypothetical protein
MAQRLLLGVWAFAVLGMLPTPIASADKGVALDSAGFKVNRELAPGNSYTLPAISVRNPGSERANYRMGVDVLPGQTSYEPQAAWFAFSPTTFELAPGESQRVQITMDLPYQAAGGKYEGLIVASIVAEKQGSSVGGAAAARIEFQISPAAEVLSARDEGSGAGDWWPYVAIPGVLLLAFILLLHLARTFRLRIERR